MVKQQQPYKCIMGKQGWGTDEFEHRRACWAQVRNNWSRAKLRDKRLAKHRMNQIEREQIKKELEEYDGRREDS